MRDDAVLKSDLIADLEFEPRIDAKHITVATDGDKIILEGCVPSWHEPELAESAAWAAPHVTAVHNMIAIDP